MSESSDLTCEIGHFECDSQRLVDGKTVPYLIVEVQHRAHYVLHLNGKVRKDRSVLGEANTTHPQYVDRDVSGGGILKLHREEEGLRVTLEGVSDAYGQEPDWLRESFRPIIVAKLRRLGLKVH